MREYKLSGEANPRGQRPVYETNGDARRICLLVDDKSAIDTVVALNGAYGSGRDDLRSEWEHLMFGRLDLPTLDRICRAAAELWDSTSGDDPYDVLSQVQKQALDLARDAWAADHDEEMGARPAPGQAADNFAYVLRCGHEIDVPAPIEPGNGTPLHRCSVHGWQPVSLAADRDGEPLFPFDTVAVLHPDGTATGEWAVTGFANAEGQSCVVLAAGQSCVVLTAEAGTLLAAAKDVRSLDTS